MDDSIQKLIYYEIKNDDEFRIINNYLISHDFNVIDIRDHNPMYIGCWVEKSKADILDLNFDEEGFCVFRKSKELIRKIKLNKINNERY